MSVKTRKQIASRKRNAAERERQAKYDWALNAYAEARKEAIANGTKLPNIDTFVPTGGF
jgi:hypothetical protein